MNKRGFKLAAAMLACILSVVACGPGQRKSDKAFNGPDESKFPLTYESKDKEIKGGVYKVGVSNPNPIKGIFTPVLQNDAVDFYFSTYFDAPLFESDENFDVTDKGLAKIDIDTDNKTVTVTLKDNLKWDDGQPMTIDDYIYTYEVVGNKDYTGVRYDNGMAKIVGMEDYHEGKADSIKGLEKLNDTAVKIHFEEMSPVMRKGLGGLCSNIIPKHILSKIPIKDLEKSDPVRLHPVGAGPFKVVNVVPGESIECVPNPYYYRKDEMPKVDKLIVKVVPTSSVLSSMKNGEYDQYKAVTEDIYTEYKDFDNLVTLGRPALYYQYLGFNLGTWDKQKGECVPDKNAKMYDINLRKAMAYALDMDTVTKSFYNGLRTRANGVIPPIFKDIYDPAPTYTYNPEKAKEILDKAGYKDVNGDGIREDKNGKPLEIFFGMPASSDSAEPMAQKYIQDWKAVGLKVSLSGGRLIEGNSFFDRLEANDKGIDIWLAAWGVGTAMDLNGQYSIKSQFNFSRYSTPENEELINKVSSLEGLKDPEYRVKSIKEWHKNYMNNVLGFLPVAFKFELTPYNKRVKFATMSIDPKVSEGKTMAVTAQQPYKSTK